MTDTYAMTGAEMNVEDGIMTVVLGAKRTPESGIAESKWLYDHLTKLKTENPGQRYGVLIDFKNIKVEDKDTVATKTMGTRLVQEAAVSLLAVVQAAKSYQIIIRSIVFALSKETGKMKFFDSKELALEWLKTKQSA